jgi:hypothetical protein
LIWVKERGRREGPNPQIVRKLKPTIKAKPAAPIPMQRVSIPDRIHPAGDHQLFIAPTVKKVTAVARTQPMSPPGCDNRGCWSLGKNDGHGGIWSGAGRPLTHAGGRQHVCRIPTMRLCPSVRLTHGRWGIQRTLLGSVAEGLARISSKRLLLIRGHKR